METISFNDFTKVELRTAKVLEVVPHPDADRLYLLQLEVWHAPAAEPAESSDSPAHAAGAEAAARSAIRVIRSVYDHPSDRAIGAWPASSDRSGFGLTSRSHGDQSPSTRRSTRPYPLPPTARHAASATEPRRSWRTA